jgi:hypothetical protein
MSPSTKDSVTITIKLSQNTVAKTGELKTFFGCENRANVIVECINLVKDIADEISKGSKIIIEEKGGERKILSVKK